MRRRTPAGSKQKSKSIGHYLLGKSIGQGTFGKVKLGTHILTGEKVAIKVLDKHRIVEVADVERVSREILILKRINYHDVVRVCARARACVCVCVRVCVCVVGRRRYLLLLALALLPSNL